MTQLSKWIGTALFFVIVLSASFVEHSIALQWRRSVDGESKDKDRAGQPVKQVPALMEMSVARVTELERQLARFQDDYGKLQTEHENLKRDRDNLIRQTKRIMQEKNKLLKFEEDAEKARKASQQSYKDNQRLKRQLGELQTAFDEGRLELERVNGLLLKANEMQVSLAEQVRDYEETTKRERDSRKVKKLRTEMGELKHELKTSMTENRHLQKQLKDVETRERKDLARAEKELEKLERDRTELERDLAKVGGQYDSERQAHEVAEKRVRSLNDEIKNLPRRMSEVARQNKKLIEETANMHYNLGVFYSQNGQFANAAREFEKALELKSDDAPTHYNLGFIYAEHASERGKAMEHFERYLELAPNDRDAEWVRRYLLTWQAYYGKELVH